MNVEKTITDLGIKKYKLLRGRQTGEILVEIIENDLPNLDRLESIFEVKSIYQNKDGKRRLVYGSPVIYDKIGRYTFQISPHTPHDFSAEDKAKYDEIKKQTDIKMGDNVLVLNCGVGIIPIYLSTLAKKVVGVDPDPIAIRDAADNVKLNKIKNCQYFCRDANEWMKDNQKYSFNKIIIDPPHAGLNKKTVFDLGNLDFEKLIYVSCNPESFARDLKLLRQCDISAKTIQPLDISPQTHYIELVAELIKKNYSLILILLIYLFLTKNV